MTTGHGGGVKLVRFCLISPLVLVPPAPDFAIMNGMKKLTLLLMSVGLLAACTTAPTPVVIVPTLASLPTLEPSATAMPALTLTPSASPTPAPTFTASPIPSDTATPPPTFTVTFTPSPTGTNTPTEAPTATVTPSLTITNTITPTPSPTFTASPELDSLGMLALLSERATVLPPEQLYNPPTLTAVAHAAETLIAERYASSLTPVVSTPAAGLPVFGTPVFGTPQLATLPPALVTCALPPPGGLGAAFAADPTLTQLLGCPQGSSYATTTAVQAFEHGTMIYVQSPSAIYVLTLDGRFRRFDDTWVSGVDPEIGGETPPLGLIEPKRGFGKVWRLNLDVRGSLGWGVTDEQGASGSYQAFDHGRALFLPPRGDTILLIDDPGGASGTWRSLPTSF